ncbi:type I pullulanase [Caloranaerobacter azorensis]|uniref:type I pullulanase n=1 Tax=Caloranaerobacter azorensis TaxID=116090 RepID=UPI0009DDD5C8|nr:type I pullulanase [Caloranaerobacter azorensis]
MFNRSKKIISLLLVTIMMFGMFLGIIPNTSAKASSNDNIIIDGKFDDAWNSVPIIGESPHSGFEGYSIDNLRLYNDSDYLFFWVDAVNVPSWGEKGMFIDIALNVNDEDSGIFSNPWGAQFNFNGTNVKPNYHIMMRLKNDSEVNGAALYSSSDFTNPILATWTDLKGAEFAIDRNNGFEGKIPLKEMGLKNGDKLKAIVVLSGNEDKHGAFDVIPSAEENTIADDWDKSSNPNIQSVYSSTYVIAGIEEPKTLEVISTKPYDKANDVSVDLDKIEIDFSEDISLLSAADITVSEEVYSAVYSEGSKLILNLEEPLKYDTTYTVNIPEGVVKGLDTGTTNKQISFSFTTETAFRSPVVEKNEVTFIYKGDDNTKDVRVAGAFNNWAADGDNAILLDKGENNIWTKTLDIPTGVYGYKFIVDGNWILDPLNDKKIAGGYGDDSKLIVPGIIIDTPGEVEKGDTVSLTAEFLNEDGNKGTVTPNWKLDKAVAGVTLDGNKLIISQDAQVGEKFTIEADINGYSAKKEITILEKMYTYTINYYRYDGKQRDWDMWIWEDGKEGSAYPFTGTDEEGFATATYKFPSKKINIITRPGNWSEQEMNRAIEIKEGDSVEVWIIQGEGEVYYNREDADISDKVLAAMMDSLNEIYVTTTNAVEDSDLGTFRLIDVTNGNKNIQINATLMGSNRVKITVQDSDLIDVRNIYKVESDKFKGCIVTMRKILDDPKFYYDGNDLGLTYTKEKSTFKVWAPTAKKVSVALYDDAGDYNSLGIVEDHSGGREIEMSREENGVWTLTVNEDLKGKYYMYRVEFADGTVNYAVDPYAKAVSANGQRTAIVDLEETNFEGWNPEYKPPMINPTDAVIYELHVRDFSIDENSGIVNKGKFKAFTETGTTYNGIKTGIDSLEELGVTHVHLLPSFDFKTVNELTVDDPNSKDPKFNWGYDPQNYNVPEGSYSTDPQNPVMRIKEFKEMVQALHNKGIRVIMDVVYNHTFNVENGPFNKIVPGYFYRTDDIGRFTNGSGCGNEVATERPMVRKYIKDSVRYWAEEYNVDGFRFDLMGLIDVQTMSEIAKELHEKVDPTILVYGEPWQAGGSSLPNELQTTKGKQRGKGFAVFNDNLRGAIKGGSDDASKGFATGEQGKEYAIVKGIMGSVKDFTDNPTETINYVTAHDNLNLWDKIIKTQGLEEKEGFIHIRDGKLIGEDAEKYDSVDEAVNAATVHHAVDLNNVLENETVKRSLLANGIVLTSQGIPFIHAGDELLRTKFGDHNSYKSPDAINKIRWEYKAKFKPVFDYYKGLIELRKTHPAFRMTTKKDVESNIEILRQDGNVVAYKLKDYANNDTWRNIVVIYNANKHSVDVNLPNDSDTWNIVVNDKKAGTEVIETIKGSTVTVEGLSMMVLYDKANDYTPVPTSIELDAKEIGLEVGDVRNVKAVVKDQNGKPMLYQPIEWLSSDENVAIVNNGRITAVKDGDAVITAKVGDIEETIIVHVGKLVPSEIIVTGENTVFTTRKIQLTATVKDQYGQEMTNASIQWISSNTEIAVVDSNGEVTGIKPGQVTIIVKAGEVTYEHKIEVKEYVKRYIRFKYIRPDKDYTDWNLWVWFTGVRDGQIDFEKVEDGAAIANIEISPDTKEVGFILRKGTDWSTAKQDIQEDRYIKVDPAQVITKVIVTSMVKEFKTIPSVNGPVLENGGVTFYYRDEELYRNDAMDTLDGVKVKIDGKEYDMEYVPEDELYVYTLRDISEGTHEYSFVVTKDGETIEIPDPKNVNEDGKSYIVYKTLKLDIKASVTPNEIDYNQNAVLSLEITSDGEPVKVKGIYADLSALGGSKELPISDELKEISISVRDDVTAGTKTIPIKVIDEYGKEHFKDVTVEVKPRLSVGELDFDWDEARIYFIVTDRFNDGDKSNNDPYNIGYDTSKPGTYHGGDFAGIIEKLDYLKELGINTIWITPIVENIKFDTRHAENPHITPYYGYHGYWASNFEKLNPHFGTLEDFHRLIDEAHERGIKIMVDVVVNHIGYGLKENDPGIGKGIPNFPTDEDRERFKGMLRENPSDGDPITQELAGLPDVKTEDPKVREKIINWQVAWVKELGRTEKGNTIDYFRVDTVKHVDDVTWMAFKNELTKVKPDFKLIGETFGAGPENTMGDLGSGKMDSLLDFHFKYTAQNFVNGEIDDVEKYLEKRNGILNNTATFGQFLGSHDEDGFLERVGRDLGKLKVAASLQVTAKGQPVIYYGEELGMSGKAEYPYYTNRYDMPWDKVEGNDVLEHYKKILNIRKAHSKVMAKGIRNKIAGSDEEGYLVFERKYGDESIVIALNVKNEEKTITVKVPFEAGDKVVDEYSGNVYTVDDENRVTFSIPSMSDGGTVVLCHQVQIKLESIKINAEKTDIEVGETIDLSINGKMSNGKDATEEEIGKVKWETSDDSIASVDDEGKVTGKKEGKVEITAKSGDIQDKIVITVKSKSSSNEPTGDKDDNNNNDSNNDNSKYNNEEKGNEVKDEKKKDLGTLIITKDKNGDKKAEIKTDENKLIQKIKNEESDIVEIDVIKGEKEEFKQVSVTISSNSVLKASEFGKKLLINTGEAMLEFDPSSVKVDEKEQVNIVVKKLDEKESDEIMTKVKRKGYKLVSQSLDFYLTAKSKKDERKLEFSKPIVVTIKFDAEKVFDKRKIGVYYYNEKENSLQYVGGNVKDGDKIVFEAEHFSKYMVMECNKTFTDVDTSWAKDEIEVLAARHIVDGLDGVNFAPNKAVTRAEFAKLLVEALDLEAGEDKVTFYDVPDGVWYKEFVETAASLRIVTGYKGEFNPNDRITREAMAAMIVRALKYIAPNMDYSHKDINFADRDSISDWAKDLVGIAYNKGIVNGVDETTFAPKDNATRAQAAAIIYRLLHLLDRI